MEEQKGREHKLIKSLQKKMSDEAWAGVIMEIFDFSNDRSNETYKDGYILRPTNRTHFSFDGPTLTVSHGHGRIKVQAKFFTDDVSHFDKIEKMVVRGFMIRHPGILKPLTCSVVDEVSVVDEISENGEHKVEKIPKAVVIYSNFDQTLTDWLQKIPPEQIPQELGKNMIRSGLTAIDYICTLGYTADHLDNPASYVMCGGQMKILPDVIRPLKNGDEMKIDEQHEVDVNLTLKTQFANLLENHIRPLWEDQELDELIALMKNPRASLAILLHHPLLSTPAEREVMHKDACPTLMTYDQIILLRTRVTVSDTWVTQARLADEAFWNILSSGQFDADAPGALYFARIVTTHYRENLNTPAGRIATDYLDNQLKTLFPGILCKWYALNYCDADFISAGDGDAGDTDERHERRNGP